MRASLLRAGRSGGVGSGLPAAGGPSSPVFHSETILAVSTAFAWGSGSRSTAQAAWQISLKLMLSSSLVMGSTAHSGAASWAIGSRGGCAGYCDRDKMIKQSGWSNSRRVNPDQDK